VAWTIHGAEKRLHTPRKEGTLRVEGEGGAHKVQQTTATTPSGSDDNREQSGVLLAVGLQGRGVGQACGDWARLDPKVTYRLGPEVANGLKHMKHHILQFRMPKRGLNL
jgi:hypothetical protein